MLLLLGVSSLLLLLWLDILRLGLSSSLGLLKSLESLISHFLLDASTTILPSWLLQLLIAALNKTSVSSLLILMLILILSSSDAYIMNNGIKIQSKYLIVRPIHSKLATVAGVLLVLHGRDMCFYSF